MNIGGRLKEILKIRRLSAREFAKMVDISEPMIYKYYKMDSIDSDTLKKWASTLCIPVLYFLDDDAYSYVIANESGSLVSISSEDEEDKMKNEFFDYIHNKKLVAPYYEKDSKDQEIKSLNREIGHLQARIEQLEEENRKLKE